MTKPTINLDRGSPEAQDAARRAREIAVARIEALRGEGSFGVFIQALGDVINDHFDPKADAETILNQAGYLVAALAYLMAYSLVGLANANPKVRDQGRGVDWVLELLQQVIPDMEANGETI